MNSLVEYSSSSDSENESLGNAGEKKINRLPLPSQIRNMELKSIHEHPKDDPNQHEGRIRSFHHERGNWATFVYIPVNIMILDNLQTELIELLSPKVKLKPSDDVHISLTRTVILLHHWIDSFTSSIRNEFSIINRFTMQFQGLKVYCNEERTRTFIAICVSQTISKFLEEISKKLDTILMDYHLPGFYKDPSFHCSILWCTGDYEALLNNNISHLEMLLKSYAEKHSEDFQIVVKKICCKIGNKLFQFDLS